MNRRGVALVIVVVLAIGFGAWWLSALPVGAPVSPAESVVERGEAPSLPGVPRRSPEPAPFIVTPASSLPETDAGAMAEVEIEVVENGKQLIGTRVEIEGPGGRQSRPTDVMGFARFTVAEGVWRITKPRLPERAVPYDGGSRDDWSAAIERSTTTPIEVKGPLTRYRLHLPTVRKFRGIVLDTNLRPLPGVDVTYTPFGAFDRTVTSTTGVFTIESTEETLQVLARRGPARSMVRTATPEQLTRLLLDEWTQLHVEANPKRGGRLYVRVMHRDEIVAVGSDDEPLLVPVGHLSVLARRSGALLSGRAEFDARAVGENRLEIELKPTPPITGKLVDAAGRPMPGLGVHFREVAITEVLEAAQASPTMEALTLELKRSMAKRTKGADLSSLTASTRTNHQGEFSWAPGGTRNPDPIYEVVVVELWRTKAESVLVKLDDAPLEIVVEPATK